jgi:hypothetical protein
METGALFTRSLLLTLSLSHAGSPWRACHSKMPYPQADMAGEGRPNSGHSGIGDVDSEELCMPGLSALRMVSYTSSPCLGRGCPGKAGCAGGTHRPWSKRSRAFNLTQMRE